jgi:type IV pilus assembly protein PilY1
MMQAKDAATTVVSSNTDKRFGLFTFDGMKQECGSTISNLTSSINGLKSSGSTPLANTYKDIVDYFRNDKTSPILHRCQQNFVVVVSDGYPRSDDMKETEVKENVLKRKVDGSLDLDADGNAQLVEKTGTLPDWDGVGAVGSTPAEKELALQQFLDGTIDPKSDGHGKGGEGDTLYLDDLAKYGYDIDLRGGEGVVDDNDVSFDASDYPLQNLMTFTIGFTTDNKMLEQAADYGHGAYKTASNGSELTAALNDALDSIGSSATLRTVSPVTLSSGFASTDTKIFYSEYTAQSWSAVIKGFNLTEDGQVDTRNSFTLSIPAYNARNIFTFDGSDGIELTAEDFNWSTLAQAQQDVLCSDDCTNNDTTAGSDRLSYILGDKSKEQSAVDGTFRNRTNLLGDIMNSAMVYVKEPSFRYTGASYAKYKTDNQTRKPVLYVGANDGMLHAFDLTDNENKELFAYIPNKVFPNLINLTEPSYNTSHKFFVDGTPTVGDAYFSASSTWHTVLAGGLNKGGQGIYALDVSDPEHFSAADDVLWEFTDADDADLGYTYSRPAIVKMAYVNDDDENVGKWAAVFGNGYNNTEAGDHASGTGKAALYIAYIEDGVNGWDKNNGDYVKISLPFTADTANGLATVAPVDLNGDFIIDRIYAADISGNLWRFNVSDTDSNEWSVTRIFIACRKQLAKGDECPAADRQAITTRPEVGRGPTSNSVLVYFGTGRFLTNDDPNDKSLQTFYAVKDDGVSEDVILRSQLQAQTIVKEFNTTATTQSGATLPYGVRVTSAEEVNYTSKNGWYLNLAYNNQKNGERVISDPILRNGRIIFTTNYYIVTMESNDGNDENPPDLCSAAGVSAEGKGWLMELDALMGNRLSYTPFDLNNDHAFTSGDYVNIGDAEVPVWVPVSGRQFDGNIASPTIAAQNDREFKFNTQSTGTGISIQRTVENPGPGSFGRQSWQQLK